jgi:isoleucyl-tRNA synthetase
VLDVLFQALVRYAAPVLVFTAEEVWTTRFPERGAVHLQELHPLPAEWRDEALEARFVELRAFRDQMNEAIEPLRREKKIGSSLAADVTAITYGPEAREILEGSDFSELGIIARFKVVETDSDALSLDTVSRLHGNIPIEFEVAPTSWSKCGRCWRHLPDVAEDGTLCDRCEDVVGAMEAAE